MLLCSLWGPPVSIFAILDPVSRMACCKAQFLLTINPNFVLILTQCHLIDREMIQCSLCHHASPAPPHDLMLTLHLDHPAFYSADMLQLNSYWDLCFCGQIVLQDQLPPGPSPPSPPYTKACTSFLPSLYPLTVRRVFLAMYVWRTANEESTLGLKLERAMYKHKALRPPA